MTQLIIARHGNTFSPGETPTRVGGRTDLPLSPSGVAQAKRIGQYFDAQGIKPDVVYAASLQRAQQTASHALPDQPINTLACFNEIDYGPDENKTDAEVIARIGQDALDAWNQSAIVPPGWLVDPYALIQTWMDFANTITAQHPGQEVFVVTSNGIARFAPYLTQDFEGFSQQHTIKLKTGALAFFKAETSGHWSIDAWNVVP